MARTILVAGTASHVGKSTVAAGLCRLLDDRGFDVTPFKAQNMSNNARVAIRPHTSATPDTTDEWGEIGVSQYVQARAARVTPTTDHNPVLLKPRGSGESQLVLQGRAVNHFSAGAYFDEHWERARTAAKSSYRRLAADADVIVAEGAGSIAEINLHDRDLANVETARFADASILLLVDIERGGAFASLYGTLELLPGDLRDRVVGAVITKFRGDESLLEPGIRRLETATGVPILGVVPYADPGLPEEDSVALPDPGDRAVVGADDGIDDDRSVTIGVPRLPRASNTTDVEALSAVPGVRIEYVPIGPTESNPLSSVDGIVLTGTKNTVDDWLTVEAAGLDEAIVTFDGPIVGICGGYQLLGERIRDADLEGTGPTETVSCLGLLPVETTFEADKNVSRSTVAVDGTGPIAGASGTASGYEIHAGHTEALESVDRPLGETSAVRGNVLGTYLHGLFDESNVREAFVDAVYRHAGRDRPQGMDGEFPAPSLTADGAGSNGSWTDGDGTPYDRAARLIAEHVDLDPLGLW